MCDRRTEPRVVTSQSSALPVALRYRENVKLQLTVAVRVLCVGRLTDLLLAGEAWTPPKSYPLPQLVPLNEVLPYAGFPLASEIIHAPPPLSRTGLPLSRDVIGCL